MTYTLALADRAYSSWSLRGWLLFEKFGIPVTTVMGQLYDPQFREMLADFAPSRTVPALKLPDGTVVPESMAIAEELASRHPDAGIWPSDPSARAIARSLAAEMHAGFMALREACPMNMRVSYSSFEPDDAVLADLRRLELIWDLAREKTNPDGPWLCGDYSAADAFFAPVAARVAGYGLEVSPSAQAYVDAHLNDDAFRRWRSLGVTSGVHQSFYDRPYDTKPWPGPKPLDARAVDSGPAVNDACIYSGKPVTHYVEVEGIVYGVCNAGCQAKTVADAGAWPQFIAAQAKAVNKA